MEKFSIKADFKNEIDEIWNNKIFQNIDFLYRGYAVQDEIAKESILFIGINPSFSGSHLKNESHFYNNEQEGKIYPYFRKFQDISKKTGLIWSHMDLLYIRETNQKNVENIISNENGKEFIHRQLQISKKIIEKAKPRLIVVSNSFARRLLNVDFKFVFDNNIGTHKIIEHSELQNTPIFFTSMLTGQRALDLGSYERLVWHINQILQTKKNNPYTF